MRTRAKKINIGRRRSRRIKKKNMGAGKFREDGDARTAFRKRKIRLRKIRESRPCRRESKNEKEERQESKFCHHQPERMKSFSKDIDYSTKESAAPQLRKKHIVIKYTPN
jgi:hypothetical protein